MSIHRKYSIPALFLSSLTLVVTACGGGRSGPCSGGGMEKDPRELPAEWAALQTIPPGAIACHEKPHDLGPSIDTKYKRLFEVGSSPHDGYAKWRVQLVANGWRIEEKREGKDYTLAATKQGNQLSLFVTGNLKDFAWSSVHFTPAPQQVLPIKNAPQ